jgi:hypothetical protein
MTTLRYGVFNIDNHWKLFRETERTGLFDTRAEAISAAESAARSSMSAGYDVELYLEHFNGELKRADLRHIGH